MNARFLAVGFLSLLGALAPLRAQLVHVAFTQPDNLAIFTADSAEVPWNLAVGNVDRLDVYFDPASATAMGEGVFNFTDASKAFWRVQVSSELGNFQITRPLASLTVFEQGFTFFYFQEQPGEFFDFTAGFAGPISENLSLPTQPLPPLLPKEEIGGTSFLLEAGQSMFPVEHLADVVAYGGFGAASLRWEPPMSPVPEPSTYAFGALALMGLAAVVRRTRRCGAARIA